MTGQRLRTVLAGGLAARAAWSALRSAPPGGRDRWDRRNHRGATVTLLEGPALALAAAGTAGLARGVPTRLRIAGALAALGAGAFGVADDLGERGARKGLRGHVGALARGELTTGGLKLVGIGVVGLGCAALAVPPTPGRGRASRAAEVATAGALIAGCANLVNLLDLRPGRALKAVLLAGPTALADHPAGGLVAVAAGPAAALLPLDLAERAMLGDGGANAAGAVLGTALAARLGPAWRLAALAGVVALTLASERVSFTSVIESTPVLRELDALGRRPR